MIGLEAEAPDGWLSGDHIPDHIGFAGDAAPGFAGCQPANGFPGHCIQQAHADQGRGDTR